MSVGRVSGSSRKTNCKTSAVKEKSSKAGAGLKKPFRFIGVSLSGGKSDKACVAVVEYFPEQQKIFLARLYEKVRNEESLSADYKLHEIITQFGSDVESVAFDVPLTLPKCLICPIKCAGYETCSLPENKWMRELYQEINRQKKPKKTFTPYTQRCVEAYIAHSLEESFEISHALGSNMAPLTARAQFLKRRLSLPLIEVFPKLSIWRIGQNLKVAKSHLKFHKHVVGGDESRRIFLQTLADRRDLFFYQQDFKAMVENNHSFEAFICAYTGLLKFLKQTEPRPSGFPKTEAWIEFPKA